MGKLLLRVISFALKDFLFRILMAFGVSLVTYKGLDIAVMNTLDKVAPLMAGLPADVLSLLALSGVFEALTIIASAYVTAAAINAAKTFFRIAT